MKVPGKRAHKAHFFKNRVIATVVKSKYELQNALCI